MARNGQERPIAADLGGAGRGAIWIDKASRKPVKTTAVMPQMNGATMLMELQPWRPAGWNEPLL
jgi:hypothetical protein